MKSRTLTKIIIALLSLSLLLCTGIVASAADAEDATAAPLTPTENGPEIVSQNIAYNGYFGLVYAIDAASVSGGSVKVNVYDAKMNYLDSFAPYKQETIVTVGGTTYTDAYLVETSPVAAKDMADQYYAQAVDADGNVGELKRYSVAEYVFQMLYANGINEATDGKRYNQKLFLTSLLEFGSHAQTVLINDKLADGEPTEALVNTYKYLRVSEGYFEGGYTTAVYPAGTEITVTYEGTASNRIGWTLTAEDGTATNVVGDTVTVSDHATLTPYYSNAVTFEDGVLNNEYLYSMFYLSGTAYDAGTAVDGSPAQVYSIVNDPDDASNKVLKLVSQSNVNSSAGQTFIELMNDDSTGSTYVFEARMRYSDINAKGNFTTFYFGGMTEVYFRLGSSTTTTKLNVMHSNATSTTAATVKTSVIPNGEWFNIRIEFYKTNDAATTTTRIYVGADGGELEYVCDINGYESADALDPDKTADILRIKHATTADVNYTLYLDDVSYTRIDKAYEAITN